MRAGAIHYKISNTQVSRLIYEFCNGSLEVLVNVNVANEGFDLPSIDCLVLGRVTFSEIIFVQQIGRALRRGKDDQIVCILDLAFNLRRRWKILRDILSDEEVTKMILSFWKVSNFVGDPF